MNRFGQLENSDFVTVCGYETGNKLGSVAVRVQVATHCNRVNLSGGSVYQAAEKATRDVYLKLVHAMASMDDDQVRRRAQERNDLLACFPETIFVEEIANGYHGPDYFLPWYVVTTKVGRFTIGWRKRVIEISWKETVGTKSADTLFRNEEVTKEEKMIHASNREKAKWYIDAIIGSAA